MKSLKNVLFIIVLVLVVLAQVYYFFSYFKRDKQQIEANKEQIDAVQIRIDQLEERLKRHEESKKELEKLQIEKVAVENKIPTQKARSQVDTDLIDYFSLINAVDGSLVTHDAEVIDSSVGSIYKVESELSFVSTYKDSRNLAEHLTNMYQMCNVVKYNFDASIQKQDDDKSKKYRFYFGSDFDSIGVTSVTFDVYYRYDGTAIDEIYQPDISGMVNKQPFKNSGAVVSLTPDEETQSEDEASSEDESQGSEEYLTNAEFLLSIGDSLTPGDVYKLSGPGETEASYIGLNSTANVTITITIYNDSYELRIEDTEGNVKETSVSMAINSPQLRIMSTMKQMEDVMPNVHININNYTDTVMKASLSGTLLDNIHIYNEKNQEVVKGQTQGNLQLI